MYQKKLESVSEREEKYKEKIKTCQGEKNGENSSKGVKIAAPGRAENIFFSKGGFFYGGEGVCLWDQNIDPCLQESLALSCTICHGEPHLPIYKTMMTIAYKLN